MYMLWYQVLNLMLMFGIYWISVLLLSYIIGLRYVLKGYSKNK